MDLLSGAYLSGVEGPAVALRYLCKALSTQVT